MTTKKPKKSGIKLKSTHRIPDYESNALQVLEHSLAFPGVRALRAMRVESEIKLAHKNGRMSTIAEIEARHNFTPEAAQKFLTAIGRAMRKKGSNTSGSKGKSLQKVWSPVPTTHPSSEHIEKPPDEKASSTKQIRAHLALILADIRKRFEGEIRTKGEQTSVREGFVYLATHPSFEGWVKAGMTIDYELRLGMYNTADPLSRFTMPSIKWVPDRRAAERQLLSDLGEIAIEMRGEWARMPLEIANQVFESTL